MAAPVWLPLATSLALFVVLAAAVPSARVGTVSSVNAKIDGEEGSQPFVLGFGTELNGGRAGGSAGLVICRTWL